MRYVLDTNVVAAALNGHAAVVQRLNEILPDDEAVLPAIVLAELRYGALSSARVAENLARIERAAAVLRFAPVDRAIAERFGDIKASLRKRALAKSDADLLVAATAVELAGILVTHDRALLDESITGLRSEDWLLEG